MQGRIHSIESMGLLDGPGIRTIFFLQGCPLRCLYCHNPDSQPLESGRKMSADEVVSFAKRYSSYYGTEGGVTFSGGEPLLQGEFLAEVLPKLKAENISTCIDTSGFGNVSYYSKVLPFVDTLLLDVKAFNREDFKRRMKGNFQVYLDFLKNLERNRFHGRIWIRHVMVPGWSDNEQSMELLLDTIQDILHFVDRIEILPYHVMGVAKYRELGIPYQLEDIAPMDADKAKKLGQYANRKFAERLSKRREAKMEEVSMKNKDIRPRRKLDFDEVKKIIGGLENKTLLDEVDDNQREDFLKSVEFYEVPDEGLLFAPGDKGEQMYVLLSGAMKIVNFTSEAYEQILYVYGAGDFIGGHNVQFDVPYHYYGEMLEDSIVAVITKELYSKFLANQPRVLTAIMHKSFERIRWAEELIARLSSTNATMKVAAILLQFKDAYSEVDEDGRVFVKLPIDREEMGSYVGLPRDIVNRKLGEFRDLGYIDYTDKQRIEIKDMDALREYCF